jgi:hypothetical protein
VLSRVLYVVEVDAGGSVEARPQPRGALPPEQLAFWTTAIDTSK